MAKFGKTQVFISFFFQICKCVFLSLKKLNNRVILMKNDKKNKCKIQLLPTHPPACCLKFIFIRTRVKTDKTATMYFFVVQFYARPDNFYWWYTKNLRHVCWTIPFTWLQGEWGWFFFLIFDFVSNIFMLLTPWYLCMSDIFILTAHHKLQYIIYTLKYS